MAHTAIRIDNLWKGFPGRSSHQQDTLLASLWWAARHPSSLIKSWFASDVFWSLRNISFEVQEGEILGIIGPNGAGKSTLLKILSQISEPSKGRVVINGSVSSLLEVGTGFHPELDGRENVYLNGAILGMRKREIDARYDEIVAFSGVGEFMHLPVKKFSSGMRLRLAFSVSAHLNPDILLVDEILAVGDETFQKKCLAKMNDVAGLGRTVILVSHNLGAIDNLCSRVLLLRNGELVRDGDTKSVISYYLNDGVKALAQEQIVVDPLLTIQCITLRQGQQVNPPQLAKNAPFTVELIYRINQAMPDLLLGFDLVCENGQVLFRTFDLEAAVPRDRPGCFNSILHFPSGFFKGQTYFLELLVAKKSIRWISQKEHRLTLTFMESETHSLHAPGLIQPIAAWSVSETR